MALMISGGVLYADSSRNIRSRLTESKALVKSTNAAHKVSFSLLIWSQLDVEVPRLVRVLTCVDKNHVNWIAEVSQRGLKFDLEEHG